MAGFPRRLVYEVEIPYSGGALRDTGKFRIVERVKGEVCVERRSTDGMGEPCWVPHEASVSLLLAIMSAERDWVDSLKGVMPEEAKP